MRQLLIIFCLFVFVANLPIEVKDIENLFPPQNTFLDVNGKYKTIKDQQIGEDIEEKAEVACIPKQQSQPNETNTQSTDEVTNTFEDNTPLNGTLVDDPMEVRIYKPECDD